MIDLHTHSTASDGSCPPRRLVALAVEARLSAIALTDHDTLAGIEEASLCGQSAGIRIIPGVEIEIASDNGEFHLLGLALGGERSSLETALAAVREHRRGRNARMVAKFQRAGFPVTLGELGGIAGGEIVSRAHFAQLLVEKGIVGSIEAAFSGYIGKGREFYEPKACLGLSEAVSLIAQAGGAAVIAHPVSLGIRGAALRRLLRDCRDLGVSGIEAWHPNHTLKETAGFARMARALGMIITGGSDFHGEHMPHRRLGFTSGGRAIPDSLLDSLP